MVGHEIPCSRAICVAERPLWSCRVHRIANSSKIMRDADGVSWRTPLNRRRISRYWFKSTSNSPFGTRRSSGRRVPRAAPTAPSVTGHQGTRGNNSSVPLATAYHAQQLPPKKSRGDLSEPASVWQHILAQGVRIGIVSSMSFYVRQPLSTISTCLSQFDHHLTHEKAAHRY